MSMKAENLRVIPKGWTSKPKDNGMYLVAYTTDNCNGMLMYTICGYTKDYLTFQHKVDPSIRFLAWKRVRLLDEYKGNRSEEAHDGTSQGCIHGAD